MIAYFISLPPAFEIRSNISCSDFDGLLALILEISLSALSKYIFVPKKPKKSNRAVDNIPLNGIGIIKINAKLAIKIARSGMIDFLNISQYMLRKKHGQFQFNDEGLSINLSSVLL